MHRSGTNLQYVKATLGDCPDVRAEGPYNAIADVLCAARKPRPGGKYPCSPEFVQFYSEKYRNDAGVIPFILAPHGSGCLEWHGRGGDEAGFGYADFLANYMAKHDVPSAALRIVDGQPPIVSYDGLTRLGHSDLRDRVEEMCKDETLIESWNFDHTARAHAAAIGHHFFRLSYRQILRFTSYFFESGREAVETVSQVVTRFAAKEILPLPVYFSNEVSWDRRCEITELLRGLPLDIKLKTA